MSESDINELSINLLNNSWLKVCDICNCICAIIPMYNVIQCTMKDRDNYPSCGQQPGSDVFGSINYYRLALASPCRDGPKTRWWLQSMY